MPATIAIDNKFVSGLKTDFTGLNYPENACTSSDNITFDLLGNITRREGIDLETNHTTNSILRTNRAISTFIWSNAGGDGNTKLLVTQVGDDLFFYRQTDATLTVPLSHTKLASTVTLTDFLPFGGSDPASVECQYAEGNGYLFVFHPQLEPFYCTYAAGVITSTQITLQIRDTTGISETDADNFRPLTLTNEHTYNLINQGWSNSTAWTATSATSVLYTVGIKTFTVQSGLSINVGDAAVATTTIRGLVLSMTGLVTSYSGTTLVVSISSLATPSSSGVTEVNWNITKTNAGFINTWFSATGNYPSNADVWWNFKDSTGVFTPSTTYSNITLSSTPAPKGSVLLPAFNQNRSALAGIAGLTTVSTTARPRTGTWFQGRVWYTGVDASFQATGDAVYYTWTENIYFSQTVEKTNQFGKCYDTNDPTSETLFDLLPTDGGVIVIQGSGSIYKLFPVQNGLLVFAANGIWFITGSQGIGFAANDYTITKISSVQSISSTSFVDVLGYPAFWNEEGIYNCVPGKQGGLSVNSLTVGNIGALYSSIPLSSKKYARGVYNPIEYVVQWIYRNTESNTVTTRYEFDSFLNYNSVSSAFYTWSVANAVKIHSINYVVGPGGSTSPPPVFKYLVSYLDGNQYQFSFADAHDLTYTDWASLGAQDYTSTFTTGYRIPGQGAMLAQIPYLTIYGNSGTQLEVQSIWDFTTSGDTGRWSSRQFLDFTADDRTYTIKRIRIRGRGRALQLKFLSQPGQPMSLIGWSIWINVNEVP